MHKEEELRLSVNRFHGAAGGERVRAGREVR